MIKEIEVNYYKNIHLVKTQPYLISFLNEGTDLASFPSFENWFQSIAPLNLKLPFKMPFIGILHKYFKAKIAI